MKLILCRNKSYPSKLIQKVTWSRWSHVGIVDGDVVIEAIGIPPLSLILVLLGLKRNHISLGGVVETPIKDFINRYKTHRVVYIEGSIEKARSCIGMEFDAWGILGIKVKRQIHCSNKMFCSKLVAYAAYEYRDRFIYTATVQKILEISRDEP